MQYKSLGNTGMMISIFSLGTYMNTHKTEDLDSFKEILKYAYEKGINHFDTAEEYGNGVSE